MGRAINIDLYAVAHGYKRRRLQKIDVKCVGDAVFVC